MDCIRRCAILVLYDSQGIYDDYIVYLIKELQTVSERLITVCNGGVSDDSLTKLKSVTDEIIIRDNEGFDAGAYRHVLLDYLEGGELLQYDEIILCNDTFFGPFQSFVSIFAEMDKKECDFGGIDYIERGFFPSFIGSYFLVFRCQVIKSGALIDFFRNQIPVCFETLSDVILGFEKGIFTYLKKRECSYDSLV